jgi:hypothetical protein
MVVQALEDLGVLDLAVTELVLAGPVQAFILNLYELLRLGAANGALCGRGVTLMDIPAYETSEFLFHK